MAKRKYFTEEERLEARKKYYQDNKQKILERQTKYYQEHKDNYAEYYQEHKYKYAEYYQEHKVGKTEYLKTKEGRAYKLIKNYKYLDKKQNRGECDLTVPWFVRNIYTKCIYCGETDWKKLGCDRINNDLPHTIENVVPACWECNTKRHTKSFEEFYWEMKHKKMLEDLLLS